MAHAACSAACAPAPPPVAASRHDVAGWREVSEVAVLVSRARQSLEQDPGLARFYLDALSAMLAGRGATACQEDLLLARHPAGFGLHVRGGLAAWQLRRVLAHIDDHLIRALPTDELAAVARISAGHFCRAFKASVGEPPHAYITRQRIRRAQRLMLESADSLAQIAVACGLADQAHLTRLFRRTLGTTPMAWRRTWRTPA